VSKLFRYAVSVRARNRYGNTTILCRSGGGQKMYGTEGYYPSSLWHQPPSPERRARIRYFDPSKQGYAWQSDGPDYAGPYEVLQVLAWGQSDDPLKATKTGFASQYTTEIK
jgi:hypothetical protein